MNIRQRLTKLEESINTSPDVIRIVNFIIAPGVEPVGYVCGNISVIRKPNETVGELQARCLAVVTWPDFTSRFIFDLLDAHDK